jgi:hypothetical protein
VKLKKKEIDALVLLQQQIIATYFRHMSLLACCFTLHALLKELKRAV